MRIFLGTEFKTLDGAPIYADDSYQGRALAKVLQWMNTGEHSEIGITKLAHDIQEPEKLTLAKAVTNVLMTRFQDEQNMSGTDLAARYALGVRIHNAAKAAEPVDLSAEDITRIKALLAKIYSPLIVGQCYAILDPIA